MLLPCQQASWLVRKIFSAREWQASDLTVTGSFVSDGRFNIKKVYIYPMPCYPKVSRKSLNMLKEIMPKYQFIIWMKVRQRLATIDRLARWGIQVPQSCVLCDRDTKETHAHLFFNCQYSKSLWKGMMIWLRYQRSITN